MPRVALTQKQKDEAEKAKQESNFNKTCICIMKSIRHKKALGKYKEDEFAELLGISKTTLRKWLYYGDIRSSSFEKVIIAATRCGVSFEFSPPVIESISLKGLDVI